MPRRAFWLGLLAIAMLLSGSLSAALGMSSSNVLLTPTLPPANPAYLPLVAKAAAPPATALPSATATLAATATATVMATATTATAEPTATATITTTATSTATSTATATAEPSCLDYHYPITFQAMYLENNPPNWYKPVTLAAVGLSPYADNAQIPSLNTTNNNSPRFRVYRQSDSGAVFGFVRWNGATGSGSASQLAASLSGRGNLAAGFSEMPPPPSDPDAQAKINGILESGDWMAGNNGSVGGNSAIMAALDYHIGTKTLMVLPVHDLVNGTGTSPGSGYRVQRFVTVRLLGYNLSSNPWFELALVQDNTGCASVPPTPTTTATATVSETATTTATTTATATASETATSTATATATSTSTATATPSASPTATATATATATPNCLDYHYPITFQAMYLENNPPNWYKPVTLASVGLSPYADNAQIPSLNTTNNNSPRFRVYRDFNGLSGLWAFADWNSATGNGSTSDLIDSLSGAGNLTAGFSEMPPPPSDPDAQAKINGILESGDWMTLYGGYASGSAGVHEALDYHIASKTQMVLPVYDLVTGAGPSLGYRVQRFATVRLLGYSLSANSWLELALVQDNTGCANVPPTPTPTATATATATATSTATATATQPAGSNQLTLDLTERLQWYDPGVASGSYDIVIVHDFSYSMRFCWTTNQTCSYGSRRIDYAADTMRSFVNEMLQVRNIEKGGDNRLALVTYSQTGRQEIPFNNDTNAALAAFANVFGTQANPKTIENSQLPGNTNTTDGLVKGVSYLNGARTVDKYGKPVRLAVLLLTDGLNNVLNDGGYASVSNRHNQAPFYCGDGPEDMDNPLVQSTCPSDAEFPNINPKPLPPLKAMIKAADTGRAARPTQFYAVVMGSQFGLDPQSMFLTEVAPHRAYMASTPAQLADLVDAIEIELGLPCSEYAGGSTPAAGASVTITNQAGASVGTFTADAQGRVVVPSLPAGAYTLSAAHLGVVAPADPLAQPRNYSRMVVENGSAAPVGSLAFVMPDSAHALPKVRLIIDNSANAQCP